MDGATLVARLTAEPVIDFTRSAWRTVDTGALSTR